MRREADKSGPIALYCSYHRQDLAAVKKLDICLNIPQRKQAISIWYEGLASAGDVVEHERAKYWKRAQLLLLFISQDYLADNKCHREMEQAIERAEKGQVQIIPLLLSPSDWQNTSLEKFQPLPEDKNFISLLDHKDKAFVDIAKSISSIVDTIHTDASVASPNSAKSDIASAYSALNEVLPPHQHSSILQRETYVSEIYTTLTQGEVSTLVLTGLRGAGKSILAALVYDYAEKQRLTGTSYFNREPLWLAITREMTSATLLAKIAQALGESAFHFKDLFPEDLTLKLFHLLNKNGNRRLIVLDGFEAWLDGQEGRVRAEYIGISDLIDILNSSQCACRLIITSLVMPQGKRPSREAYMQKRIISGFTEKEGVELLHKWGIQATEKDLAEAVRLCKGHPLALVFLDKLLSSRHLRLSTLLGSAVYKRLWVNNATHNLFNDIYQQLNELQRHLLQAYAIYRKTVPWNAVYAVLKKQEKGTEEQVQEALEVLLTLTLLQADTTNREEYYVLHPFVAEFVRTHFFTEEQVSGSIDKHQAHMEAAYYYQQQHGSPSFIAQKRTDEEYILSEAVWHYCQAEQWQAGYELWKREQLFTRLRRRGEYAALLELYTLFLGADKWQVGPEIKASLYNELGVIYNRIGAKEEASRNFKQALEISQQAGCQAIQVKALNNLGSIYRTYGQVEQALSCYQEALHIAENAVEIVAKGIIFNNMGRALQDMEKIETAGKKKRQYYWNALSYYKQALVLHKQAGDALEEARTRNNMGEINDRLERPEEAYTNYMQALNSLRQLGEKRDEGVVCNNLGTFYMKSEQYSDALEYFIQALHIFQQIGTRGDEAMVTRNLGSLFLFMQQRDAAVACFVLAQERYEELHQPERGQISRGLQMLLTGEESFAQVLADVGPHAAQILEETLKQNHSLAL